MTDLIELIKTRRTIRAYKDERVPEELINKVLEAGRWAPSAHNLQPWKFVVINSREKIIKLAGLLEDEAANLLSGLNIVMKDTAGNLRKAPVIILVYSDGTISKKFNRFGEPYKRLAHIYEVQSIATAIENMMLYGWSQGIGMAWYGMPLFCQEHINETFGQKGELMAILSLGYPEKGLNTSERKKLSEIVEFIDKD